MSRAKSKRADDPLLRDCPACGARARQGCIAIGKDSKPIATRCARLVHAARLEELTTKEQP